MIARVGMIAVRCKYVVYIRHWAIFPLSIFLAHLLPMALLHLSFNQYGVVLPSLSSCFFNDALIASYASSFSHYPIFQRQFLSCLYMDIYWYSTLLSYHAAPFAPGPSRWSHCAYIASQVGLRGNRSPSAFPNNLSKTGLLIIQKVLGSRACDKWQGKESGWG